MNKIFEYGFDGRNMNRVEIIDGIFGQRKLNLSSFLNPSINDVIGFEDMENIDRAYSIIDTGLKNNKSFLIYADVDVDGCTSAAIMYQYLKNYTNKLKIYINKGKSHGVKKFNIKNCKEDIIIIVDSIDEPNEYLKFINAGKQIVVLDHHIIPNGISNEVTIVSSANGYKNPQLSGAGVVWKFCRYLDGRFNMNYASSLIDLAACGIVADMCDITSPENRYICNVGFKNLKNTGLKSVIGGYEYNSQSVSFSIAPLVNAAQRMNKNKLALSLFLQDDSDKCKEIIKKLKKLKEQQNEIIKSVLPITEEQAQNQLNKKVMVFVIDVDYDVRGLLANKLIEKYQRPVLVLGKYDTYYAGSARGYGVENFKAIVDTTKLAFSAGHENAFGIRVGIENLDKLQDMLCEILKDVNFEIKLYADVLVEPYQIDERLIEDFKQVNKISGEGFSPLSVMIANITDYEVGSMSNGKHLKIVAGDLTLIKWNYDGDYEQFDGRPITVIGELNMNRFRGNVTKQVIMSDFKVGE